MSIVLPDVLQNLVAAFLPFKIRLKMIKQLDDVPKWVITSLKHQRIPIRSEEDMKMVSGLRVSIDLRCWESGWVLSAFKSVSVFGIYVGDHFNTDDIHCALYSARRSDEQLIAMGCFLLYEMKKPSLAEKWFQEATDSVDAEYRLGLLYRDYLGDDTLGVYHLERAALRDHPKAIQEIAKYCLDSVVDRMRLLKLFAEKEHVWAMTLLGHEYLIEKNGEKKALYWMTRAYDKGKCLYDVGSQYIQQTLDDMSTIGWWLFDIKERKRAKIWIERSRGSIQGMVTFGKRFHARKRHKDAFDHFKKAAELGHPEGMFWFGKSLWKQRKYTQAVEWLQRAISYNNHDAANFLGERLIRGVGIQKNLKDAYKLLHHAATYYNHKGAIQNLKKLAKVI